MKYVVLALFVIITACTSKPPTTDTAPVVTTSPMADSQPKVSKCDVDQTVLTLKWGQVVLPKEGRFVLESHLATKEDTFGTRAFPKTVTEGIPAHLNRSCELLDTDCADVYTTKYHKEWTPPEGGKAGQGSVGDLKPSVLEEMWTCNMMWSTKPKAGTKFLIANGKKTVVTVMGYETGPGSSKWLGGCQGEVLWALGAKENTQLTLAGVLKDQAVPPGPITCE